MGPTISGFSSGMLSVTEEFSGAVRLFSEVPEGAEFSGETVPLSVISPLFSGSEEGLCSSAVPDIRYSKLKGTPPKAEEYAVFPASSL